MPIYEYACAACGHEFEEWQKMSDAPVRTCPKCKKKKVERLISRTAFQLKGSGWYADLYSSSKGKESKSDATEKAEAKGASDSSKDTVSSSKESSSTDAAGKSGVKPGKEAAKKKETAAKKADSRAA